MNNFYGYIKEVPQNDDCSGASGNLKWVLPIVKKKYFLKSDFLKIIFHR